METRNGSNRASAQYVWGTQYTDEIIFVDINGSPVSDNDCNPDQGIEAQTDSRYFYHQDRQPLTRGGSRREPVRGANIGRRPTPRVKGNWNVVAISLYDTNDTNNGRLVERYSYTPYGQFVVLKGDSGSGEMGNLLPTSTVGNVFAHQGLPFDHEKTGYQNRHREYVARLQCFVQRDPLGYVDSISLYPYARMSPVLRTDALRTGPSFCTGSCPTTPDVVCCRSPVDNYFKCSDRLPNWALHCDNGKECWNCWGTSCSCTGGCCSVADGSIRCQPRTSGQWSCVKGQWSVPLHKCLAYVYDSPNPCFCPTGFKPRPD